MTTDCLLRSVSVVDGSSVFGNSEPRLEFVFSEDSNYRLINSCLYTVAAGIEFYSNDDSPWVVVVDREKRNVHLELVYEPENREVVTQMGLSLLRSVLKKYPRLQYPWL